MSSPVPKCALLLVDIQYDFLPPSGSLAVQGGEEILPVVYDLMDKGRWDLVVTSQDYHPASHISFAATHSLPPFTTIQVPVPPSNQDKIDQVLWPIHCQQGTKGVEIEVGVKERLDKKWGGKIVRKGMAKERDDYSAFAIPLGQEATGGELQKILGEHKITTLYICGLATDYCVRASALSALEYAYYHPEWKVVVIRDAVRGVDKDKSEEVLKELEEKGVKIVGMDDDDLQDLLRGA